MIVSAEIVTVEEKQFFSSSSQLKGNITEDNRSDNEIYLNLNATLIRKGAWMWIYE